MYAYNGKSDSFYTVSEPASHIETYYSFDVNTQSYIPMQPPKEVFYEAVTSSEDEEYEQSESSNSYYDTEEWEAGSESESEFTPEFYVTTFTNEPSPYSLYFYDS
jgi:hypothetical protein